MVARRLDELAPSGQIAGASTEPVLNWLRDRLSAGPVAQQVLTEAIAMVEIVQISFNDPVLLQLAALSGAGEQVSSAEVAEHFGLQLAKLLESVGQLNRVGLISGRSGAQKAGAEQEILRRMMLAMAVDIRVVLIRLAQRLRTLRKHADSKTAPTADVARETLEVLSPLANRLGLWQIKWELEDLAFRFLEPITYKRIAAELEERRIEREQFLVAACSRVSAELVALGCKATVSSRPKHIYSIHGKMQAKQIPQSRVLDLRGMRIIVADVNTCYQALSLVHRIWSPVAGEYDDYIAKPKPNGYQSLHTVVRADDGRALEIQIRTTQMHHAAEFGLASHWAYKEASVGVAGSGGARVSDRGQLNWLRQLLAWQQDLGQAMTPPSQLLTANSRPLPTRANLVGGTKTSEAQASDEAGIESNRRIFVLTPQGRVIELPEHATPIDFAYHVHTDLGHRCRGARVDSQMVPLNTPLRNGQTIEVITANKGLAQTGPSMDWLNVGLGYLRSARARAKVRQWFNAQQQAQLLLIGRERVERAMQREGKTSTSLPLIASRLGLTTPEELFLACARDELGPRALEQAIRNELADLRLTPEPNLPLSRPGVAPPSASAQGSVLVVGVDLLLTQLARCCRPIPPDTICGFVTRGRGISVHRQNCTSLQRLFTVAPERIVETTWGSRVQQGRPRTYSAEITVEGDDRSGLARDMLDACARDRVGVTSLTPTARGASSRFQVLIEVADSVALEKAMTTIRSLPGVHAVARRQTTGAPYQVAFFGSR